MLNGNQRQLAWNIRSQLYNVAIDASGTATVSAPVMNAIQEILANQSQAVEVDRARANSTVIDMDSDEGEGQPSNVRAAPGIGIGHGLQHVRQAQLLAAAEPPPPPNGPPPPTNNTGINDLRLSALLGLILSSDRICHTIVFLFILFAKLFYEHSLGLLVFIALIFTFEQANKSLKQLITKSARVFSTTHGTGRSEPDGLYSWNTLTTSYVLFLPSLNILALYYVFFPDQELYKSLYLSLPNVGAVSASAGGKEASKPQLGLFDMLWILIVTDYALKFMCITVKTLLVFVLPVMACGSRSTYRKRGCVYLVVEQLVLVYRQLVPVPVWMRFLHNADGHLHGGDIIAALYVIAKAISVFFILRNSYQLLAKALSAAAYAAVPCDADLKQAGELCPICQESFVQPVKLKCNHLFCEDCVSRWFDRDSTCPMCRQKVVDRPLKYDGDTDTFIQFF